MKKFMVEYIAKDPINGEPIHNYLGRVWVLAPTSEIAISMVKNKYKNVYKIDHVYLGA